MAIHSNTWQCVAIHGNTYIHGNTWVYMAVDCHTWQYMGIHGNTLQYLGNTVIHSNTWVYMAVHCYTWQYMGIHGNRLQYVAVHGYTWLYMAVHVNLIYRNLLKLNYMLTYYWVGAFIQTLIWGGRLSKNCFRPLWCPWPLLWIRHWKYYKTSNIILERNNTI